MALPSLDPKKPQLAVDPEAIKMRTQTMGAEEALHPIAQAILDNTIEAPVKIDPRKVRWSTWGNRHPSRFEGERFAAFVEDIRSSKGNNTPGVVRRLPTPDKDGFEYEIASGHRRHRACLESNQLFNAFIRVMTDMELQVELEVENRNREDVSHIERAKQYKDQLATYRSQEHMAATMKVPTSTMGRYLQLATLPQEVLDLVSNPLEITLDAGISMVQFMNKEASLFKANLEKLTAEEGRVAKPFKEVFASLKTDQAKESAKRKTSELNGEFRTSAGHVFGSISVNRQKQIRICIDDSTPEDYAKIEEAVKKALKHRFK